MKIKKIAKGKARIVNATDEYLEQMAQEECGEWGIESNLTGDQRVAFAVGFARGWRRHIVEQLASEIQAAVNK